MIDQERPKDRAGGEALRKHRERRRAIASRRVSNDADNKKDGAEITSLESPPRPAMRKETGGFVSTVVVTETAHDRMRKISKLGLADPADMVKPRVRHGARERATRRASADMIVMPTDADRDRMRKVSVLGLEDPVDVAQAGQRNRNRTRRPSAGGGSETRPSSTRDATMRHKSDLGVLQTARLARASNARNKVARSKSDDVAAFKVPFVVPSPSASEANHRRIVASNQDFPLLERNDVKVRGPQSIRLEKAEEKQENEQSPAMGGFKKRSTARSGTGPMHLGGIVEPTLEQQDLMRKVSALGLEDPVFGNLHKDTDVKHASMIFEDMDMNDVPQDMRDLVSLASDHTDPVNDLANESLGTRKSEDTGGAKSRRSITIDESTSGMPTSTQLASPKQGKKSRIARQNPGLSDATKPSNASSDVGSDSTSLHAYIPPTGSFNLRKPNRKATPSREAVLKDAELASRAQSMFANDNLLAMSASNLGASLSNLSASFTSGMDLEEAGPTEAFVPPQNPLDISREDSKRVLPSVESIYASEDGLSRTTTRPKSSRPPPNSRGVGKTTSSRSWDGDEDLLEPVANTQQSMWSSLSQLDIVLK